MFQSIFHTTKKYHRFCNILNGMKQVNLLRYFSGDVVDGEVGVMLQNGVKTITLSNEKNRNALNLTTLNKLRFQIKDNSTDVRVVVLKAKGRIFSSGFNLKELTLEAGKDTHDHLFDVSTKLMVSMIESPVPIIAAVNGPAVAAGCQLVAACDIAVCTTKSSFSTPGANVGIFCSTPGIALSRRVSRNMASYMLFTGATISAEQALRAGLVCDIVDEEKLEEHVKFMTDAICSKSKSVIQLGKQFFYQQLEMDAKSAYRQGENIMKYNVSLKDGQEGIKSFLEKRKANWTHTMDSAK